ncbi:MAG: hypothetical protein LBD60_01090, partial [Puniceicoccales bacterium]|nr:hypothetical protein [Puniceicoccales bacterium]
VFTETEKIDAIPPWHHIHLGRSLREVLPMDKCPVVIGYGVTGLKDGQIPCHLRSSFSAEQMRSFWRLGIKKAIILKGLDLNGQGHLQNMQGCMCAEFPRAMTEFLLSSLEAKCHQHIQSYNEYIGRATAFLQRVKHFQESKTVTPRTRETMMRLLPEQVKQFLEKAKNEKNEIERIIAENRRHLELFGATKPSYSAPLSGGGFSGSLVVRKSDDERYDVFGIFGGPLFTSEIKDFIENAAQYHHEKLSLRKRWARHLGQFWGMDPFIFSKIKRISFTGSNFIPGSWGTDFCNR